VSASTAPMQLESDKIILPAGGSLPTPQIVLPGREKGIPTGNPTAVIKLHNPSLVEAPQGPDNAATPQVSSCSRRLKENGLVQHAARDADRREREVAAGRGSRRMELNSRDRNGAKRGKFDAEIADIVHSLTAYELAADLVVRASLAFDQDDLASGAREMRGNGAAGDAAPDDQRVDAVSHWRARSNRIAGRNARAASLKLLLRVI
jgi:hypothetical protein